MSDDCRMISPAQERSDFRAGLPTEASYLATGVVRDKPVCPEIVQLCHDIVPHVFVDTIAVGWFPVVVCAKIYPNENGSRGVLGRWEIAKALGLHWRTVYTWERGKAVPKGENLAKLIALAQQNTFVQEQSEPS